MIKKKSCETPCLAILWLVMKVPRPFKPCKSRFYPAAFSLVEVALAVGVFGFGMVGIMGLLPVGLTSFRESKARTIETVILQQRTSEVLQTPFQVLSQPGSDAHTLVTGLQFYSEEGVPIGNAQASATSAENLTASAFRDGAVFASRVSLVPSLGIGSGSSTNVLRAVVEVTRLSTPGRALKTPIYVPNLGK
jgi:uncharacterized protein (TIGR02598 family)